MADDLNILSLTTLKTCVRKVQISTKPCAITGQMKAISQNEICAARYSPHVSLLCSNGRHIILLPSSMFLFKESTITHKKMCRLFNGQKNHLC